MIKRPVTSYKNDIDNKLLTDLSCEDIMQINKWIKDNIRTSNSINERNSYSLKHVLEKDTRIYLTNNQFKDAMLLAGFNPVKEDEINWRFRVALVREINNNPNPFFKWLKKVPEGTKERDFAEDVLMDLDFPVFANHDIIKDYLEERNACYAVMDLFEELWENFEKGE